MGLHPWSRGNGIKRAHLLAGIILVFGIIVAGGVLAFSGFSVSEPIAGVESPQWTQESGAGITVPACGSTTACGAPGQNVVCTTCSGNAPSVEFTWTNTGDTATLTCSTVRIGAWVTGFPAVRILDNLPCNGSATWTGAANTTNYNYEVRYKTAIYTACTGGYDKGGACLGWTTETRTYPRDECTGGYDKGGACLGWTTNYGHLINGGSFSTPNCTPAPVCSPSSVSLNTGQSQTFSVTDGTTPFTWSAPSSSNPSGSGSTHATSYSSAAGSPYTVTVTDSASRTSQCNVNVSAGAGSCTLTVPSVAAGSPVTATWSSNLGTVTSNSYTCTENPLGSGPLPLLANGTQSFTMPSTAQTCTLNMADSSGKTATCNAPVTPLVAGSPVCSPALSNIIQGGSVSFTASGGSGGYTWTAPTASPASGSGSPFNPSFPTVGNNQQVTLRDSNNNTNVCSVNVSGGAPVAPTGDIKADGSDGPISKTAGLSANLTWTSSNATSCRVLPGGYTGISSAGQSTGPLSSDVTYTLYCSNASYTDVPVDSVTINVSGAGLRPDYLVSTMSAPGSIRGGQTMTVNATIGNFGQRAYGGNTNAALCIWNTNQVNGAISVYGSIQDQIYAGGGCGPVETKTISPLNNAPTVPYQQSVAFSWTAWSFSPSYLMDPRTNPYYAIVVADDGNLVFPELDDVVNNVSWSNFTLLPPLLEAGLTAVPNSGPEILNVSLRASAWGAAVGATADYFFWWTCTNATTDVATAEGACGALPSGASEIIVDNSGSDISIGSWYTGSGLNGVPYGADSLMSNESSANYRITPNVPSAGTYDVYFWYQGIACGVFGCPFGMPPTYPVTVFNGATSQTFDVPLRGGFFLFPIPPPPNGWYKLGNFSLPAGSSAYVQFGVGGGGMGIADAVRLVPAVGACTTNSAGAKCLGVPTNTDLDTGEVFGNAIVPHNYNAVGSPYRPKVIVSSSGRYAQAQDNVTVFPNLADLVTQNAFPASGWSTTAGSMVSFGADITNQGFVDAPISQARLRIDLGNNGWTSGEPEYFVSSGVIQKFSAGPPWNIFYARWLNFWTAVGGNHSYQICADKVPDPNGVVAESDESNNCSPWNAFTVSAVPMAYLNVYRVGDDLALSSAPSGTWADYTPWPPATQANPANLSSVSAGNGALSITNVPGYTITRRFCGHAVGGSCTFPATFTGGLTCNPSWCFDPSVGAPLSWVIEYQFRYSPIPVTLSVNLTASPNSQPAPLNTNLTAAVSGSALGTMNYTFWWNCTNTSSDVSYVSQSSVCGDPTNPAIGAKFNGEAATSKSVSHTYLQNAMAKVIVERGSAPAAQDQEAITVSLVAACSVAPSSVPVGNPVAWNASATGGDGNYLFSWSGTDGLTCSGQPSPFCNIATKVYSSIGVKSGTVIVTSASQSDTKSCGTVTITPGTILNATPPTILPGGNSLLSWNSTGFDDSDCTIDQGIGAVTADGTRTVSPVTSTLYTITCNDGVNSDSASAVVNVAGTPTIKEIPPN